MCVTKIHIYIEVVIIPEYGINAQVNLVVDTTNTDDVEASVDAFESAMENNWDIESQSVFITSSPTIAPSAAPFRKPTTLQPSAKPSITGLIVTIDVTSTFYL